MTARQELHAAARDYRAWDVAVTNKRPGGVEWRIQAYERWLVAVRRFWLAQRSGTVDL